MNPFSHRVFSRHQHIFTVVEAVSTCERASITAHCPCGEVQHTVIRDVNNGDEPWHTWGEWKYGDGEDIRTYRGLEYNRAPCKIKERICKVCKEKVLLKA